MKISSFRRESWIDYPGKLATIVFTSGCNYKCPSCHAKQIVEGKNLQQISEAEIINYIKQRKNWINGIVICGGEPTIQPGLITFTRKLRESLSGIEIKLDTNGSNFAVLQQLLTEKLADYVAMDIKGPLYLYQKLTGIRIDERDNLLKAMNLTTRFPDYEFRTTIVPVIRDTGTSFLTPEEIADTAEYIATNTQKNTHKYFLQKFVARSAEEMIDKRLAKENLPENLHETPVCLIEESYKQTLKYLPNSQIR